MNRMMRKAFSLQVLLVLLLSTTTKVQSFVIPQPQHKLLLLPLPPLSVLAAVSPTTSTTTSSAAATAAHPHKDSSSSSASSATSNSVWTPLHSWKFAGFHYKQQQQQRYHHHHSHPLHANSVGLMPDGGMSPCVIKVIGVGGGGGNAVERMMDTFDDNDNHSNDNAVEFWALNTDAQVLGRSQSRGANILNIGTNVTRGLGAGGNPEAGRLAAEESRDDIRTRILDRADLVFVTAGMGGGTGSGAAPIVAQVAQECGCLTVGIVTVPFRFEGQRRRKQAEAAIARLRQHVDTVIVVSNDRLLDIIPHDTPVERAFAVADDILRQGVVGISDIIVKPGLINVDFADVRAILSNGNSGTTALMGIGVGSGNDAAQDAAMAALSSPLLDATIEDASGVVFNISGGPNLSLTEVNAAAKLIYNFVAADANVIFGALVDESLGDNISITVLATGVESASEKTSTTRSSQPVGEEEVDEEQGATIIGAAPAVESSPSVWNSRNNHGDEQPSLFTSAKEEHQETRLFELSA